MKSQNDELGAYKLYVKQSLDKLTPVFARAAIGDFSRDVEISETEDEFTELMVGIQVMLEVIREQKTELEAANKQLATQLEAQETALEELVSERAYLTKIIDAVGEGLIVIDKTAQVTVINDAALSMLNIDIAEAVGKPLAKVATLRDNTGSRPKTKKRPIHRVLRTGQSFQTDKLFYERNNDGMFPIAITVTAVKVKSKVIGAVLVFRDITKELEIEQTRHQFVALASHQLRTPVSIVRWYSQLLAKKLPAATEDQHKYLTEITDAAKRMNNLINTLLDIAKVEAGEFLVKPAYLEIAGYVSQIVAELKSNAELKQIKITEKYADHLPGIEIDPKVIRVAIENLLSNSIKYTPAGGSIEVRVFTGDSSHTIAGKKLGNQSVIISVADSGRGIPEAQHPYIFKRMLEAGGGVGSGLGLYITKMLVERAAGDIWFSSQEGKGSSFYIAFTASELSPES